MTKRVWNWLTKRNKFREAEIIETVEHDVIVWLEVNDRFCIKTRVPIRHIDRSIRLIPGVCFLYNIYTNKTKTLNGSNE